MTWATDTGSAIVGSLVPTAAEYQSTIIQSGVTYGLIKCTFSGSPVLSGVLAGHQLTVAGFVNSENNGVYTVYSSNDTTDEITVLNTSRLNTSFDETGITGSGSVASGAAIIIEPSAAKKAQGFLTPEKPSDGIWNWIINNIYAGLVTLQANIDAIVTEIIFTNKTAGETLTGGVSAIADGASKLSFTLPTSPGLGETYEFVNRLGGFGVTWSTGQKLRYLSDEYDPEGIELFSEETYGSVRLVCTDTNEFTILGGTGYSVGIVGATFIGGGAVTGTNYNTFIAKMVHADDTRSNLSATLNVAVNFSQALTGGGSETKGYFINQQTLSSIQTYVDDINYSDDTSARIAGTLNLTKYNACIGRSADFSAIYSLGGFSNAGGDANKFATSTETSTTVSSAISASRFSATASLSATAIYMIGGSGVSSIEKFVTSTETGALTGTSISAVREVGTGVNSSTKSYILGGSVAPGNPYADDIYSVLHSTDATATVGSTLDRDTKFAAGGTNAVRGYTFGGKSLLNTYEDDISGFVFTTETASTLSATLAVLTYNQQGISNAN